jgi:hypothetical protein
VPWAGGGPLSGRVEVPAALGEPPLFVRAGSVVALDDGFGAEPAADDDGLLDPGHRPRRPALHVWPDATGLAVGRWYDDAGDGHGPGRLEHVRLEAGVVVRECEGDYPGPGRLRVVVHRAGAGPAVVEAGDDRRIDVS